MGPIFLHTEILIIVSQSEGQMSIQKIQPEMGLIHNIVPSKKRGYGTEAPSSDSLIDYAEAK
ncbi:hypothetical protein GCM10025856_01620 [Methylophaga marina]|uniref:Uncharacterized protein n=1 Tax=Methylophaga marina TaxID=45495 RepID=A0ABN0TC97_9GAMM|nr:hypothetical protein GCM10025856_01620 [Methylophaga marina]